MASYVAKNAVSASSARGINGGGYIAPNNTNTMQYITIATTGNGADFGDLTAIRNSPGAVASSTRGIWMGGTGPSPSNTALNTIDYVTMASTGDAVDFGNLSTNRSRSAGINNSTRGVIAIGNEPSPVGNVNTIEFITLTTSGEATDFGDATSNTGAINNNSASNTIRGVYHNPRTSDGGAEKNILEFITIATTGNATDFGDLNYSSRDGCGLTDSHGGLPL